MLDLHLDQTRFGLLKLYSTVLYIDVLYCPRFGVLKLQWLAGRIKEKLQGVIIVRFVDQIEVVKEHHL